MANGAGQSPSQIEYKDSPCVEKEFLLWPPRRKSSLTIGHHKRQVVTTVRCHRCHIQESAILRTSRCSALCRASRDAEVAGIGYSIGADLSGDG